MQGYDVNRASKAKTAKDLGDSEPGGCEWGSVRATASEAVKGTVQRWLEVVETFQGLGGWHPDGAPGKRCGGASLRVAPSLYF